VVGKIQNFRYTTGTIKEAKLSVEMKVDKFTSGHFEKLKLKSKKVKVLTFYFHFLLLPFTF